MTPHLNFGCAVHLIKVGEQEVPCIVCEQSWAKYGIAISCDWSKK